MHIVLRAEVEVDGVVPNASITSVRIEVACLTGTDKASPGPITGKATEFQACCLQSVRTLSNPERNACNT